MRFCAFYGAGPKNCNKIFSDLQTTGIDAACINKADSFYFLMAMNWLRVYKTESLMAGTSVKSVNGRAETPRRSSDADSVAPAKDLKVVRPHATDNPRGPGRMLNGSSSSIWTKTSTCK